MEREQKPEEERILINTLSETGLKKEETGSGFQSEDLSKPLSRKEKECLIEKAEGFSTRGTQELLSKADPSLSISRKEQVRFAGKGKVEIKMVIDEECTKS